MSTTLTLIKSGNRFAAADPWSDESMAAIKNGDTVFAEIKYPRNVKHHRKMFALFDVAFKAQDIYATREGFLDGLKNGVGHCNIIPIVAQGLVIGHMKIPKSISFRRMGQIPFAEFYDKAVRWIVTDLVPGLSSEDLERQVLEAIV